jgi:hypothetical protein
MRVEFACQAVRERRCLELRYDGWSRTVEVHAVGYSSEGNSIMRVWQSEGGSNSGQRGWKLLRLDEIVSAQLGRQLTDLPRLGYKRNDRAMERIVCQI